MYINVSSEYFERSTPKDAFCGYSDENNEMLSVVVKQSTEMLELAPDFDSDSEEVSPSYTIINICDFNYIILCKIKKHK